MDGANCIRVTVNVAAIASFFNRLEARIEINFYYGVWSKIYFMIFAEIQEYFEKNQSNLDEKINIE